MVGNVSREINRLGAVELKVPVQEGSLSLGPKAVKVLRCDLIQTRLFMHSASTKGSLDYQGHVTGLITLQ